MDSENAASATEEILASNKQAVANLLERYDALVEEIQRYMESLRAQRPAAVAADNVAYVVRIDRSLARLGTLQELLEGGALDALMEIRHFQAQMRVAITSTIV